MQTQLFEELGFQNIKAPVGQLLKWIGNKQRYAEEIVKHFPDRFNCYREPFLGSGAVLATLAPRYAVGSDSFRPLIEIWQTLRQSPKTLKEWYQVRWRRFTEGDRDVEYAKIRAAYNDAPNGGDLLFICRSCYGGVVRFRKADGFISTPIGIHDPISPQSFARRVDEWHDRTFGTLFERIEYDEAMSSAKKGDLIYCDPPYTHSQAILYGAQTFSLARLFEVIDRCKSNGVLVALSIDGTKRSGEFSCEIPVPKGLFRTEVFINCGRSMLKRFQMDGQTLENEVVSDRLLLTF